MSVLTSKDYEGKIYETNAYGKIRIIREVLGIGYAQKERLFEVEFLNTGFRTVATRTCIQHGAVKDNLVPSLVGVGYLGYSGYISREEVERFYPTWSNIIRRCYDPKDKSYATYGGAGVRVDPRWHSFANFYFDIQYLYGYERKRQYPNLYQIDKDFLQLNVPRSQKVYSKETCVWASIYENPLLEGRERGTTGLFGVIMDKGFYVTVIYSKQYGKFESPIPAANLFNYIYPIVKNEYDILNILNTNVPVMSREEVDSLNLLVKRK